MLSSLIGIYLIHSLIFLFNVELVLLLKTEEFGFQIRMNYNDDDNGKLNKCIKVLVFELDASAKADRNRCIQKLGSDSLVANRKVPKPSQILR